MVEIKLYLQDVLANWFAGYWFLTAVPEVLSYLVPEAWLGKASGWLDELIDQDNRRKMYAILALLGVFVATFYAWDEQYQIAISKSRPALQQEIKALRDEVKKQQAHLVQIENGRRLTLEEKENFKKTLASLDPSLSSHVQVFAFGNCPECMTYAWDYAGAINEIPAWKKAKEQKVAPEEPESGINPALRGIVLLSKNPKSATTTGVRNALKAAKVKYSELPCCSDRSTDTLLLIAPIGQREP